METTTIPEKRPREEDDPIAEKRQKIVEDDKQDTSIEVKAGESSKTAEEQATGKRKFKDQTRRAAKEKREREKARGKRRGTRREGEPAADNAEPKGPRLPKRMSALLIGFSGAGYNGMQIQSQRDVRTIEGTLFNALVKAGAVSEDNADNPTKVSLGRAARTDAGVHAAGNVVSMKLITQVPGVLDMVARINEELPPEIRVWQIARVQNSFNARSLCDSRKYTYYFPSYLLIPPKPGSGLQKTLVDQTGADPTPHPFWAEAPADSSPADDMQRKRKWRATPDLIGSLRAIIQKYEGPHNFYNFTVGREFGDRSTVRFMKRIEVTDPVIYGETEWISVLFHGQSFMLHQRKMMAALVLVCRTGTPPEIIEELYGPRALFVPKMPALGLLLEYPIFQSYNNKIETSSKLDPSNSEYRPAIDFEPLKERMENFKQDFIYSRMRSTEDRDGIFDAWVRSVDKYAGNDLLYLNSKGVIPANAVIKKTERRANPFREKRRFDATSFPEGGQSVAEEEEEEEEEEEKFDKKALADMED